MTQLLAISVGVVPPMRLPEMWGYLVSILLGATLYAIFVASLSARARLPSAAALHPQTAPETMPERSPLVTAADPLPLPCPLRSASVFTEVGASSRLYRSKLDEMEQYMRHHGMPKEMRTKLRAYYELCFPGRAMFDESSILSSISHPLRSQIALHKTADVLESLKVLHDSRLSRSVAALLERMVFVHGDFIIIEGEQGRGMYFVSAGFVDVLAPIEQDNTKKSSFGQRRSPPPHT
jgi:hypothetical protein